MTAATYTFGDTQLAAARLALVARAFAPPSRLFLRRWAPRGGLLAVDLGCGPGYTTRLVAEVARPRRTVGLDSSEVFLSLARATAPGGVGFAAHDVTATPFPVGRPDLAYCRLLLAHLPEPAAVVERWVDALAPGGRLLLDEVEWIDFADPVLHDYEAVVRARVAAQGAPLYAGPALAGMDAVANEVVEHGVRVGTAARMFAMNLAVWGGPEHAELGSGLIDLANADPDGVVGWGLRQVVVEKAR